MTKYYTFDIRYILIFRLFPIAITADNEKAFLQIGIKETDRDYLRFLWVDDILKENPKIIRNRFARVVFGVTSSPYLLNATIRKHNNQYTTADPDYVQKTLLSFFIDDCTVGQFSIDTAFELYKKLKLRSLEGHINLRKWRTNNQKLREKINETESILEKVLQNSNILGLIWDEEKDVFIFDFAKLAETASKQKPSKRSILSILSSFYDTTGFNQTMTVTMKVLFQDICNSKINWDDKLSQELKVRWFKIITDISDNCYFETSRPYVNIDDDKSVKIYELPGFVDANLKAYGACVYLRTIKLSGEINVKLVAAKSRVSPLNPHAIPRNELLGN